MSVIVPPQLLFDPGITDAVRAHFAYGGPEDAIFDPRGRIVRYAPWRRTVMHELADGSRVFCKIRSDSIGKSLREWNILAELSMLGLNVPAPLFLASRGRDSVMGLASVPGRPVEALLVEGRAIEQVLREMPAVIRRLHGAGWVYRDLYWNHVFAAESGGGLWLVDVERAFRPRSRFERWRIKDLAGLVSSWPESTPISRTASLRFLSDTLDGPVSDHKRLIRATLAKAARIRNHITKYPG
jgi:Lipopolysaccharide kinase (Kdo/WaaP) family